MRKKKAILWGWIELKALGREVGDIKEKEHGLATEVPLVMDLNNLSNNEI